MPTICTGLLTLPLAGLLITWAVITNSTFFDLADGQVDPGEAAQAYEAPGYFLSQFVGYILGLTLLTLGLFSLTVYLCNVRRKRWTSGAMTMNIPGIGLLLSSYGLRAYAVPAFRGARLYGQQGAIAVVDIILGNPTAGVFYAAFLLYSASFILFSFAV